MIETLTWPACVLKAGAGFLGQKEKINIKDARTRVAKGRGPACAVYKN